MIAATTLACLLSAAAPAAGQVAPASQPAPAAAPADDLKHWLEAARDPDYATRVGAVVALGTLRDQTGIELAVPVLAAVATRDESWFVRMKAVESLHQIAPADKAAVEAVSRAMNDRVRAVRAAAAVAMGVPGEADDSADAPVAKAAVPPRPSGPADLRRLAEAVLDSPDPAEADVVEGEPGPNGEKASADPWAALGPADAWRALPVLFAAFHDRTDSRGDRAARLLTRFNPDVVPVFVEALKEKGHDPVIRRRALTGLAEAGAAAAPAAPLLKSVLTGCADKSDPDRATALRILAAVAGGAAGADDDLADILYEIAGDHSDPLRARAVSALLPTGRHRRALVGQLSQALSDPADALHADAEDLLGSAGPDARAANDALFARLASPDVTERGRAAYAIARINATAPDVDAVSGLLVQALLHAVRRQDRAVWTALAPCARRSPGTAGALRAVLTDWARQDPEEAVRFAAKNVLLTIGADSPPASP